MNKSLLWTPVIVNEPKHKHHDLTCLIFPSNVTDTSLPFISFCIHCFSSTRMKGMMSDIRCLPASRYPFSSSTPQKQSSLFMGTPALRKALITLIRYTHWSMGKVSPTWWVSLSYSRKASTMSFSCLLLLFSLSFPVMCFSDLMCSSTTLFLSANSLMFLIPFT